MENIISYYKKTSEFSEKKLLANTLVGLLI